VGESIDKAARPRVVKLLVAISIISAFLLLFVAVTFDSHVRRVRSQAAIPANTPPPGREPNEVGRDCRGCHSTVTDNFILETHGKSAKFLHDERASSCQVCHTNSAEHADKSTRQKSGADPGNPGKAPAAQANESCLQCHSRDRYINDWKGSKHDRNDVSCVSCHSVHHRNLPQRTSAARERAISNRTLGLIDASKPDAMLSGITVEETCLRCHTNQRKAFLQRSTHFFRTENRTLKIDCSSCHNPHGGEGPKMMQARTINSTCFQCHADKRGPFLWEHTPVQENCMTCHAAHGSNFTKLLARRSHQQCQQCHINMLARHQTVAGFDVFTIARGCVNCHTQVHGSNHPSGRAFTR